MGKRKPWKAREKSIQKMTRNGLISENQSTGEVHKISTRSSDFELHHETSIEQDFTHRCEEAEHRPIKSEHRSSRYERSETNTALHSDFHDSRTISTEKIPTEPIFTLPQDTNHWGESIQESDKSEGIIILNSREAAKVETLPDSPTFSEKSKRYDDTFHSAQRNNERSHPTTASSVSHQATYKAFQKQADPAQEICNSETTLDLKQAESPSSPYEQSMEPSPITSYYRESANIQPAEPSLLSEPIPQSVPHTSLSPYSHALAETHTRHKEKSHSTQLKEQMNSPFCQTETEDEFSHQKSTVSAQPHPSIHNSQEASASKSPSPKPKEAVFQDAARTGTEKIYHQEVRHEFHTSHAEATSHFNEELSIRKETANYSSSPPKTDSDPLKKTDSSYNHHLNSYFEHSFAEKKTPETPLHPVHEEDTTSVFTEVSVPPHENGIPLNHRTEHCFASAKDNIHSSHKERVNHSSSSDPSSEHCSLNNGVEPYYRQKSPSFSFSESGKSKNVTPDAKTECLHSSHDQQESFKTVLSDQKEKHSANRSHSIKESVHTQKISDSSNTPNSGQSKIPEVTNLKSKSHSHPGISPQIRKISTGIAIPADQQEPPNQDNGISLNHRTITQKSGQNHMEIAKNSSSVPQFESSKKTGQNSKENVPLSSDAHHSIGKTDNPRTVDSKKRGHSRQSVRSKAANAAVAVTVTATETDGKPQDNGITLNHRQEKPNIPESSDRNVNLADKHRSDTKAEPAKKRKNAARKTDRQQLHAIKSADQCLKAGEYSLSPDSEKEPETPSRKRSKKPQTDKKTAEKSTSSRKKSAKSKFHQADAEDSVSVPEKKTKKPKSETSKKKSASHFKLEDSDLTGGNSMIGTIKAQTGKAAGMAILSASTYVHGKIHEVEHENSAVEGSHKAELLAEKGVRELRNYQKGRSHNKRQKIKASRLQESPNTEQTILHPGTPLSKGIEKSKPGLLNRFYQKLRNKRQAAEAARQGKKVGEKTVVSTTTVTEKAVVWIREVFVNHKHTIYIILALLLVLILLLTQLQSCSVMVTQSLATISASSWPAKDEEITAADLYYTQLEASLQHKIDSIESSYPNYDEYNYNVGEIGHDPVVLISYLCAKYGSFKADDIKSELDTLFALQYRFHVETKTEQRTVTKTVRAGESLGMVVTSGYCNCSICCGQWAGGPTASGVYPTANHTIAVDASNPTVPMGTEIIMNGTLYKVEDTGAFDQYGVDFDVYYDNHSAASAHGHQTWEAFYAGGDGEEIQVTTTEDIRVCNVTLSTTNLSSLITNRMNSDQQELYQVYLSTRGNRQFLGTPIACNWYGNVSSYYGYRTSPTTGAIQLHRGLDIAVPQGTEILAVQNGTVKTVSTDSSYGNYVVLENDKGYVTKYAHCSTVTVSAGQTVNIGDVIAKVGSTGNSTGPHLHIEFLYKGDYYNPYFYLGVGSGTLPGSGVITEFPGNVDALSDAQFAALIREAEKYLGMAYVWGGSSPSTGFDCSGFVSYVFTNSGVYNMGRLTAQGIYDICTPVSPSDAKPGDIIFFTGTYNSGSPVSHVGIYVGNGQMIHCGDPIQYTSINTSYWQNHFYAFGRVGE